MAAVATSDGNHPIQDNPKVSINTKWSKFVKSSHAKGHSDAWKLMTFILLRHYFANKKAVFSRSTGRTVVPISPNQCNRHPPIGFGPKTGLLLRVQAELWPNDDNNKQQKNITIKCKFTGRFQQLLQRQNSCAKVTQPTQSMHFHRFMSKNRPLTLSTRWDIDVSMFC